MLVLLVFKFYWTPLYFQGINMWCVSAWCFLHYWMFSVTLDVMCIAECLRHFRMLSGIVGFLKIGECLGHSLGLGNLFGSLSISGHSGDVFAIPRYSVHYWMLWTCIVWCLGFTLMLWNCWIFSTFEASVYSFAVLWCSLQCCTVALQEGLGTAVWSWPCCMFWELAALSDSWMLCP